MDMFGIGNAVKIAVDMVRRVSRGTGRSKLLLNTVQCDDLVIFANPNDAENFRRKIRGSNLRNIKVISAGANINMLFTHFRHSCPNGRAILDHSWIEDYYSYVIQKASDDIDMIEKTLSGNIERTPHANSNGKFRIRTEWDRGVNGIWNKSNKQKTEPLFGEERPIERNLFSEDSHAIRTRKGGKIG